MISLEWGRSVSSTHHTGVSKDQFGLLVLSLSQNPKSMNSPSSPPDCHWLQTKCFCFNSHVNLLVSAVNQGFYKAKANSFKRKE